MFHVCVMFLNFLLCECGRLLIGLFWSQVHSGQFAYPKLAVGFVGKPAHDKKVQILEFHSTSGGSVTAADGSRIGNALGHGSWRPGLQAWHLHKGWWGGGERQALTMSLRVLTGESVFPWCRLCSSTDPPSGILECEAVARFHMILMTCLSCLGPSISSHTFSFS